MYKTINFSQFCDEWNQWEDRKDTFSYEGKKALFDYLEELEGPDTVNGIELDIVALCCDWNEYDSIEDVIDNYDQIKDLEDLQDHTTVLECSNGHLLIANF